MSEEKRETKQALLGELESIKDLLSEDEWDEIPVLSDTVSEPLTDTSNQGSSAATEIESPEKTSATIVDETNNTDDSPAEPFADKPQHDAVKQQLDLMSVETDDHNREPDDFSLAAAHIDTPDAEQSIATHYPDGSSIAAASSDIHNTDTDTGTDTDKAESNPSENDNYARSITDTHSSDIDDAVDKLNLDLSLDFDDDYTNSLADDSDRLSEQAVNENTFGNPFSDQSKSTELTGDMSEFSSTDAAEAFEEYSAESPFPETETETETNTEHETVTANQPEELQQTEVTSENSREAILDTAAPTDSHAGQPEETETSVTDDSIEAAAAAVDVADNKSALGAEINNELENELNNNEKLAFEDLDNQYLADNVAQLEDALEHDLEELIHDLDAIDDEAGADDDEDDSLALSDEVLADDAVDADVKIDASHVNDDLVNQAPNVIDEYQHDAFPDLDANAQAASPLFASLSQDYETSSKVDSASDEVSRHLDGDEKLPPGVLPGQQSLFTGRARKSDSDGAYVRPERPTRATGENPFLPKHIRDRLHTNKALVDIIKETPLAPANAPRTVTEQIHEEIIEQLPPQLSSERVHHLVEDVIALYMPRIEAELRERLLVELRRIEPDDVHIREEDMAEDSLPDDVLSNEGLPDEASSGDDNH